MTNIDIERLLARVAKLERKVAEQRQRALTMRGFLKKELQTNNLLRQEVSRLQKS